MHMWLLALGVLVLSLGAGAEELRCARDADMKDFVRSAGAMLRCADRSLQPRSRACVLPGEPVCARDALAQLHDLVYGAAPVRSPDRSEAIRCQRVIGSTARSYLKERVKRRARGERSAPRERLLHHVRDACDGVAIANLGSGRLPGIGGTCRPLLDGRAVVDGNALGRCLSASIEGILDRVSPSPMPPNVVVIYTDDQRWDTVAYMPKTLDRLADRGIVFQNAFVTTPVCGPSRASMLSGRYAHAHGIRTNASFVGVSNDFDEDDTIARWLESARYRTALLGKYLNGIDGRAPRMPRGWSEWQVFRAPSFYDYSLEVGEDLEDHGSAPEDYSTDLLTDRALAFIDRHREEPFFVVLSLLAPHEPATPADRHVGSQQNLPLWRPPNFREADLSGKPVWVRFQRTIAGPPTAADALRIAMIESLGAVDEAVERISDLLDAHELTDNTLVVFTSDNGYHWGEHWWNSKFTGYEESLRVPLLMRYPAAQPLARTSDALVLNIDLAPTFAELGGARAASNVDGLSLVPLLRGASAVRNDFLFEIFDRFLVRPHAGVRTSSLKYIETEGGTFEEIYDLAADPYELRNRALNPAWRSLLDALRGRLQELRR